MRKIFKETEKEIGTFELDESYFGVERGRGVVRKTPVSGLFFLREGAK